MPRRVDVRFLLGIAIGAVLAGAFVASLDLDDVLAALRGVRLRWVAVAAVLILGEWWLRGVRWQGLIQHLDPHVPLGTLVSASMIGAAMNALLPLRGGDLVRPAVVARARGLPFAALLSSSVVERVFDIFGLSTVFVAMLLALPESVLAKAEQLGPVRHTGYAFAALGALAWAGAVVLTAPTAEGVVARLVGRLPAGARWARWHGELVAGLRPVRSPSALARATVATLALWGNGLLAIVCLFWAFELNIPATAALFVDVAIALAVVVPQAPGFVGVFHVVLEAALRLWGADAGVAQAAALVFWAVCFIPVTAIGAVAAWREGLSLLERPGGETG
jgi:uncharacterized membrane protein YbhN (UPF0104 family)